MVWMILSIMTFIVLVIVGIAIYDRFAKSKRIVAMHNTMQKKIAYSASIETPKILLVGGSDVLYSFQSDVIAEKMQQPTVNLGLNIGLGAGFLLDVAKSQAKKGDTLIISFAYALYWRPMYDVFGFEYFRMYDRKKLRYFTLRQRLYYLLKNAALNQNFVETDFDISKSGSYINLNGSFLPSSKNIPLIFPDHFSINETIQGLKDLQVFCEQQDIELYLTYPSTMYFECYEKNDYLKELHKYLEGQFQVIGSPPDYFVPQQEIYNSVYHVNAKGQTKRTNDLLTFLKKER